ncbi:hypothetical protein OIU85_019390 [Salix viminalis]|uniref:Uncharacterized protein n=1 Tax=Salix viminalis TaxID=40686 RepID=A0A9Q0UVS2_SALVM|nr:hypothetical protein OIU85_019390 [Salix viminalis]
MSASRALLLSVVAMLLHLETCTTTTTTTTTTISTAATLHYTITKAKTKASSYPDFQLLSVKQAITETKMKPLKPYQYQELSMINNPNDGGSEGRQKLKLSPQRQGILQQQVTQS